MACRMPPFLFFHLFSPMIANRSMSLKCFASNSMSSYSALPVQPWTPLNFTSFRSLPCCLTNRSTVGKNVWSSLAGQTHFERFAVIELFQFH